MKNLFIIMAFGVTTIISKPNYSHLTNLVNVKTTILNCNYGQCNKIKADGYRCGNCCQQYSNYCWSHKN